MINPMLRRDVFAIIADSSFFGGTFMQRQQRTLIAGQSTLVIEVSLLKSTYIRFYNVLSCLVYWIYVNYVSVINWDAYPGRL